MKVLQYIVMIGLAVMLGSTATYAQEGEMDATAKVKAEMEATFGVYPEFMQNLPDHLQPAAWELMKAYQSPDAALSPKYNELIGLAVAAQIPCDFCVYFHANMAKQMGASDAEIKEAVAKAADTRYWSTVLNGTDAEYEGFKSEVDQMVAFLQEQMEMKQTSKK